MEAVGHVGIYVGDIDGDGKGDVMDNIGYIRTQSLEEWIQWQVNYGNTACGGKPGWLGWGWQSGSPKEIVSQGNSENGTISSENDEQISQKINALDNVLFIGDSITKGLESSGLISNATFYAQSSTKPSDWLSKVDTLPENNDSISCVCVMLGVNGTSEIEQMKQLIDALAKKYEGKTIFVQKVLPVANTYTQIDYNTMNQNIKNFNDAISSYCNGKSNVKFIDTSNGYVDESGNGKAELFDTMGLHPLNYEMLKQNIEKAITGTTSTTGDSNSSITNSSSKYCAVVATWKETYTKREPVGEKNPEGQYSDGVTIKEMTTEKIDYQKAVRGYTMPFDYLWALVVTGREKNFAMDLADLVYGSEIEITIHDNYEEIKNIDTYTYTNKTKIHTHDISTTIEIGLGYPTSNPTPTEEWKEGEERELEPTTYTIKDTRITKTNTLDIDLTKANVWIVNYSKEYKYEKDGNGNEGNTSEPRLLEKIEYPDTPNKTDNEDPCNIAGEYSQTVLDKYNESGNATIKNINCTTDYYYYSETTVTNYNKTTSNKYVSSPANTIEKTDPKSEEDNFVTLFLKNENYNARNNILSAPDWLFEILESSERTVDMVDLTKYLLYKATGKAYDGITEYDFSIFEPGNFTSTGITAGDPLAEFLKSYENEALRTYMNGTSNDYSLVSKYVNKDRTQYRLFYTSFDNCYNFTYGIMVSSSSGLNNKQYFADEGIDLQSLVNRAKNGEDVYVDVEIIDRIFLRLINDKRNSLKEILAERGVSMEPHQIDALVSVSYQYGNCGQYYKGSENIGDLYRTYYQTGAVEEFKNEAHAQTGSGEKAYFFVGSQYQARKEATWTLFHEGRYILSDGTEVTGGIGGAGGTGGTVYYQNDYPDVPYGSNSIATSGCGPTCFAMIASDYTGTRITPADAVAWCGNRYYVNNVGTSWAYFEAAATHFNLPCKVVNLGNNINAAISELEKGNLVISSQTKGIFTSGGHFILLSSVENGGIRVRDPNKDNAVNGGYANRLFSPSEISASGLNYWSFQK